MLCLDCVRDSVGAHLDVSKTDGESDECVVCGCPLPESKKRQLKAENLILRAKLADVTATGAKMSTAYFDILEHRYATGGIVENGIPGLD